MINELEIKFKKLKKNAIEPVYSKYGDCACDLYSVEDITLKPMERKLVDTGIAIELPNGF